MKLPGRTVLVTGGAHRVGRALSLALARAGADVVVNYHTSEEKARATVREIENVGRRAIAVRADVSDEKAVERLVERTEAEFGRLDVLVNSASLFESAPLEEISAAEWDRVLGVNLRGPFLLARTAAPLLREDDGVIVNIADLSAFQAWPSFAHHSVSKAGLIHLTRILARALAPRIRSVAIAPGTVLPPDDYSVADRQREADRAVLGRIGSPEDVARTLIFLVESDYITGETITVDGGRRVR